ncbi:MAG: hypothetical protein ACXWKM_12770, partial [Phenylobacterium sp.]
MRRRQSIHIIALAALAAGCAHRAQPIAAAPISCPAGQSRGTTAELVFGRNVGAQLGVTEEDWRR